MRINLDCPFSEKDHAKALGARWDVARKTWYIENVEDLTPFMRWIGKKKKPANTEAKPVQSGMITLRDFLAKMYGAHVSLTFKAAKQFGIPWPLVAGWKDKYADKVADFSKLTVGKKNAKAASKKDKKLKHGSAKKSANHQFEGGVIRTGPKVFVPLCHCNVEPWEDCEHTEELAHKAFLEMSTQTVS